MVLVATAAGLSATVRRTGFALVPVMLVMVLLQRHRLRGSQAGAVLRRGARAVSGDRRRRAGGRAGRARRPVVEPDGPPHVCEGGADRRAARAAVERSACAPRSIEHLQADYAPIRAFLASAPPDLRAVLSIYYETCLQGGCVDRSRALMPDLNEAEQTETLGRRGDGAHPARAARVRAAHRDELSVAVDGRSPAPSRSRRRR